MSLLRSQKKPARSHNGTFPQFITNFPLALNRSPVAANRDGEKIRNVDDLDQESRYEDIYRRGGGGADHTALAASTYSSTVNSSISEGSLSSSRPLARDAGAFDRTAQKKRLGDLRENYRRLRPLSALVTGRRRTAGRSREYGSLLSDSSGDFLKGKSNSRDEITRMVENSEITRLDLGGFSWLESSFLDMLGQKCGATLRHVNLSGCNVSNLAVQCLGASCPQLSELDLSRCNKISADILTLTIPSWPLLRLLCLTGCDQLFKRVRGSGEDGHGGDDDASYYHHYGFSKEEVAAKILQHGAVYGWTVEKKGPGKQAHVDGGRTPGTNSKMSDREMAGASAPEVGDDEDRGDDEAAIQAEELAIALEIQQRDDAFQMFSALARTAPMLEELNLDSCPSLQSWQFAGFVRPDGQPMALRKVGLSCCTALEGATLQQLSENCPGLESVSLRLCDQNGMTPESVKILLKGCPSLRALDLTGCSQTDNDCVLAMSANTTALQHISIAGAHRVDGRAFLSLRSCQDLRTINIASCTSIDDASIIRMLKERRHKISAVNITGCRVNGETLEKLRTLPNCRVSFNVIPAPRKNYAAEAYIRVLERKPVKSKKGKKKGKKGKKKKKK